MLLIMINPLLRNRHLRCYPQWRARVQISVVFGKGAGTDLQGDTMARFEHLRCIPAIYAVVIDFAGFDEGGAIHAVAEAGTDHAVAEALYEAGGPDVDEFCREVGVGGRG